MKNGNLWNFYHAKLKFKIILSGFCTNKLIPNLKHVIVFLSGFDLNWRLTSNDLLSSLQNSGTIKMVLIGRRYFFEIISHPDKKRAKS